MKERYGYDVRVDRDWKALECEDCEPARVIAEHKERYIVAGDGEWEAEITGHLRFTARGREDFPAVGDWVAIQRYDEGAAIIHAVLPRRSMIARRAVGQTGEQQIIATNIDVALLVQAVDRDFSINRLERYLTLCFGGGVRPVVVLTKTDLRPTEDVQRLTDLIHARHPALPILALSNLTRDGHEALLALIETGLTYCMLGSSGVGKSTILNLLSGRTLMKTDTISESTQKGRHVTTHRELVVLDSGAMFVDNPGMREVGIADGEGLSTTFDQILELSMQCRFTDCTHATEAGCAVLAALESGALDPATYENYRRLEREREFFETSAEERKRKEKVFGRILKDYKKKNVKGR